MKSAAEKRQLGSAAWGRSPTRVVPPRCEDDDVVSAVVLVTPEMAREWLGSNKRNRAVQERRMNEYADDIKTGRWQLNAESIKFSASGLLLDGQHRLLACVRAGVPFKTLVVRGLPDDVFDTIDTGKPRNGSDVLAVDGEVSTTLLASTLAMIDRYKSNKLYDMQRVTNAKTRDLLRQYPSARDSVRAASGVRGGKRFLNPTVLATAHFLFAELSRPDADDFILALATGTTLDSADPILLLRERLIENTGARAKLPRPYILLLFIKAWNGRRTGTPMKQLRVRTDEETPVPV